MSHLKARLASAGTRRRCPRCQLLVKVPEKTLLAPPIEEYAVKQEKTPLPSGQPAYIPVTCPTCRTRVYSTAELVGQELICPDCGTRMVVPPPPVVAPPVAPIAAKVYALREDTPSRPVEQRTTEEGLIRIACLVCGTMMYATDDQVGQKMVCPDCQVPLIVQRPVKAPPKQFRSAAEIGDYPLAGESGRSEARPPVAEPHAVTVPCPICDTQLHATLAQVGAKITCPECGTVVIVPPPPPPPAAAGQEGQWSGEYGLAGWSGPNIWESEPAGGTPSAATGKPHAPAVNDRLLELDEERPQLPRWLFLGGTFTFPFTFGAAAFTFVLATWAMLPIWLGKKAIDLAIASKDTWIGSPIFVALAAVLGAMWFALASACALAVVRDTSNRCDKIQNWPDMAFIDWLFEPLFLFNGVCLSVLPGIGLAWLSTGSVELTVEVVVSAFFFFPVVLLSMLDKNSPLTVISAAVCRTFWMAWTGWVRFYFLTAVLAAAIVAIVIEAFDLGLLWGVIAMAIGLGVGWLIYFRMLGRLAWYCTERTAVAEPEEPEAEPGTSPDEDDSILPDDEPLPSGGRT